MHKLLEQHLATMIDAVIANDQEAAKKSFHEYARLKANMIIMGESADEDEDDKDDKKSEDEDDKDDNKSEDKDEDDKKSDKKSDDKDEDDKDDKKSEDKE